MLMDAFLKQWHQGADDFLVEYSFAVRDPHAVSHLNGGGFANIKLIKGQHRRLVQVDESGLNDGDLDARETILRDPRFLSMTAASKDSTPHTTLFTCTTSPGEYPGEYAQAGPCQLIFQSDAKNMENFRINKAWCTGPVK